MRIDSPMAVPYQRVQTNTEQCDICERDTVHEVWIEIRPENRHSENAKFSREPYRIATCTACDETTRQRLNRA